MDQTHHSKQKHHLALPSTTEAALYILHAYLQQTINKIRSFLEEYCITLLKTPHKEKKKYQSLTNQQITQRGYFLHYFYECILSLHQISKQSGILSKSSGPTKGPFQSLISNLLLNIDDLAKITRIKRSINAQRPNYSQTNKQIIELLYQTEIYAYQILLRIIQIKFIYQEHLQYRKEIEQLNQKYIFAQYFVNQKWLCSKKQKMTMKRLFSQMQSIYMYYHCEMSINRTQCNSKPEINCLHHLVKSKFNKQLLSYIYQHFNFKCEGQLLVPYITPETKINDQNVQSNQEQSEHKEEEENLDMYLAESNKEGEQQYQAKSNLSQSIIQKISKKQSGESQSNPSQIILTIKQENEQEIAIYASKKEQDKQIIKKSKFKLVEKEKKSLEASDDDYVQSKVKHLKYERTDEVDHKNHQKHKPSKHSSKNLSLKEKMKVLGHNQRFAHTLCNIKYVMASKSSKKDNNSKRIRHQQKQYKLNNIVSASPIVHFNKQKDQSQESFLAQQTPVHRHRAYINKN